MMDLREPKKKKRVRLQPKASLPISTNDDGEWKIYTAHLSACGTCIVDPNEMEAVYSMGFFGKGSLSRSYPSFGQRRLGAPAIIRNRQWVRRQKWLEELENLNRDANSRESEDFEMTQENEIDDNSLRGSIEDESVKEEAEESNLERSADSEKIMKDENEKNCSLDFIKEKSYDKTDMESSTKVSAELKKTLEKKTDDGTPMELKTNLSSDKNSEESNSERPEELEKREENETDKNNSIEYIEEKSCHTKDPKCSSKISTEQQKTAQKDIDEDCLIGLKTDLSDEKSQKSVSKVPPKLTKKILNTIDDNSSIEFIANESCVKRARMSNTEKFDVVEIAKGNDDKKKQPPVVCDESMNIDEVLLDSTEEEGICEIIEKSTSDLVEEIYDIVEEITREGNEEICEIVEKSTNQVIKGISEIAEQSSNNAIEEICEIVDKGTSETNEEISEIPTKSTSEIEKQRSSMHDDTCDLSDEHVAEENHNFSHNDEDDEKSIIEEETNLFEVLVLPDTDSDPENYLKNIKSRIEKEGFPVNETLHLTFEETFFLMYGLGCLQLVHYDGTIFSINDAWNHFQQQDQYFIQKYVIYHYFRSKGWVVKPGLKFGGDFLLYKQGPPFYHASYIVIVEVMDADTLIRDNVKSPRTITWKNLIGLERLSETIAKEILFAQILWPSSIVRNGTPMPVEALSEFTVRELLWRRWDPKRKIDSTSVDEEDSDTT